MSYYVCLGDIELDRVITVSQTGDREITVFDAVEAGKFPMPQHRSLKTWSIKFQTYDADTFDELDELHKSDDPVRLIINGEGKRISEKVYLKSYSMDEEYTGVYNGTISVIEHTSAGVKTIAVPYATREGTPPAVKTVTVTKDNQATWAYDSAKVARSMDESHPNWRESAIQRKYTNSNTKAPVNPAAVTIGDVVEVAIADPNSAFTTEQQKEQMWAGAVASVVSDSYDEFDKLIGYDIGLGAE